MKNENSHAPAVVTDVRVIDVFNESKVDADYCSQHNNMLNMTEIKNPH